MQQPARELQGTIMSKVIKNGTVVPADLTYKADV